MIKHLRIRIFLIAMPRALLLINPNSRNGGTDLAPILDRLRAGGIDLQIPPKDCDPADALGQMDDDVDRVIVGGGDGSLNAVVDELIKVEKPLGILPLGTANDLARTLQLPADPIACADVIVQGCTRKIDLGEVNGKSFFNVASLGLSTEVTRALDKDLKSRLGIFGYAVGLWRAAARRRVIRGEITIDGKQHKLRAIQISIGNGVYYGGGMAIAADASIDDGKLDLVIVTPQPLLPRLHRLLAFRWGRHDLNDDIDHHRVVEIELDTRIKLPINTDGEITTETPARFRIRPKAIEAFVP